MKLKIIQFLELDFSDRRKNEKNSKNIYKYTGVRISKACLGAHAHTQFVPMYLMPYGIAW